MEISLKNWKVNLRWHGNIVDLYPPLCLIGISVVKPLVAVIKWKTSNTTRSEQFQISNKKITHFPELFCLIGIVFHRRMVASMIPALKRCRKGDHFDILDSCMWRVGLSGFWTHFRTCSLLLFTFSNRE